MHSTESQNPQSTNLDQLNSLEYVQLHLQEEQAVMKALKNADEQIAQAIDLIYESFKNYQGTESKNLPEKLPEDLQNCDAISGDVSGDTVSSLKPGLAPSPERLATKEMAELTEPELFRGNYIRKNEQVGTDAPGDEQERNAADGTLQVDSKYQGPRLFYIGAGTSGRLGVLDASECPPTFSTHPDMVQGLIAGGDVALRNAVEGAEDDEIAGEKLIQQCLISPKDILIGISASGGAPFVISALKTARERGATTIAIANNPNATIFGYCDQKILLETGPEILAGSTRLKAGTAQKICLNIISTGLMVKLGKTYGNLMVDLKASNSKLKKRALD